jgi:hypothetical protein
VRPIHSRPDPIASGFLTPIKILGLVAFAATLVFATASLRKVRGAVDDHAQKLRRRAFGLMLAASLVPAEMLLKDAVVPEARLLVLTVVAVAAIVLIHRS